MKWRASQRRVNCTGQDARKAGDAASFAVRSQRLRAAGVC